MLEVILLAFAYASPQLNELWMFLCGFAAAARYLLHLHTPIYFAAWLHGGQTMAKKGKIEITFYVCDFRYFEWRQ